MAEIVLTQGKVTLIDDADYERLAAHKWCACLIRNTWYAERKAYNPKTGKKHTIRMHKEVLNAKPGEQVDHINGDGLDNTCANLRICTQAQNQMNRQKQRGTSSSFKGVSWDKGHTKWRANIAVDGRLTYLGHFFDEANAAKAYDARAREVFGQYARLNFPRLGEQSARR